MNRSFFVLTVCGLSGACGKVDLGSFGVTPDAGALTPQGGAASGPSPEPTQVAGAGGATSEPSPQPPSDDAGAMLAESPSCAGGLTCGADQDSCCTRLVVPLGSVLRHNAGDPANRSEAYVSSFYLDKYEVTVGRFRRFLQSYDAWRSAGNPRLGAGAYLSEPKSGWQAQWDTALPADSAAFAADVARCLGIPFSTLDYANTASAAAFDPESMPLNCITWFEANAFCMWDGGRLPTELEWEYAGAGGDLDRTYPWGNEEPTPERAEYGCGRNGAAFDAGVVTYSISIEDAGADAATYPVYPTCDIADSLPVGSKPAGAGRWQQLDLAGSFAEWVMDAGDRYPPGGCTNCVTLTPESARMFRGGSWFDIEGRSLSARERWGTDPGGRLHFLGLRCARTNYADMQ
jgi:sulfatase modifying factor 1